MKKTGKTILITAVLFLAALIGAGAESLSLEEVILMARENNPTLLEAQNTLKSAENDLTGMLRLEDTSLTASGDWAITDSSERESLTGSLSLSVPVIDQFSLSASVDSESNIQAGLTMKPLNMTTDEVKSQTAYDNALNSLTSMESSLDWEVLNLALTLSLAEKNNALTRDLQELENQLYQASYALYLAGDITYEELMTAMDDLTTAEDNSLTGAAALSDASRNLRVYLGDFGDRELAGISLDTVEELADSLTDLIQSPGDASSLPEEVTQARNALLLAERELATTLAVHPDLSITAGLSGNLEETGSTAGQLSVSLSLSGSSFNSREREILSTDIQVKEAELNQALYAAELEKETLNSALEQAVIARESAERDLERKQILSGETSLLYEAGERTILEKNEADLQLREAENKVFQRCVEEIQAAADCLSLYLDGGIDLLELL